MESRSTLIAIAAAVLLGAARPAAAQQQIGPQLPSSPETGLDARDMSLAEERDREFMHPDLDPVNVVGNEQGDNNLRARTPRLSTNEILPELIDEDELYSRRRAMYEQGASFTSALPPAPWSPNFEETEDPAVAAERARRAAEPEPEPNRTSGMLMLAVGAAALIAVGLHGRRSG